MITTDSIGVDQGVGNIATEETATCYAKIFMSYYYIQINNRRLNYYFCISNRYVSVKYFWVQKAFLHCLPTSLLGLKSTSS